MKLAHYYQLVTEKKLRANGERWWNKSFGWCKSTCHREAVTAFTEQLAVLLNAGISLYDAMQLLQEDASNLVLAQQLVGVFNTIQQGTAFATACQNHPLLFDRVYCALVRLGEETGRLAECLQLLAAYRRRVAEAKQAVRQLLVYPCCVVICCTMVLFLLLVGVVPQFEQLYADAGKALPLVTQFLLSITHWTQHNCTSVFLVLLGLVLVLRLSWRRCAWLPGLAQTLLCRTPYLGRLLTENTVLRVVTLLNIAYSAGLALPKAVQLAAMAIWFESYQQALLRTYSLLQQGSSLAESLLEQAIFPQRVIQLIKQGEHAGTLALMLQQLEHYYEEKIRRTSQLLATLLEPAIMIILGGVIGTMIVALYLPIFQMGSLW